MDGIHPHQVKKIMRKGIKVAFDYRLKGGMKQPARFFNVFSELFPEAGLNIPELGSQLFGILEKIIEPGTVTEVDGIQRIQFYEFEREFNSAITCKFIKFIGHAEKAGTRIESKTIFPDLV
jgi:hypothetical protein